MYIPCHESFPKLWKFKKWRIQSLKLSWKKRVNPAWSVGKRKVDRFTDQAVTKILTSSSKFSGSYVLTVQTKKETQRTEVKIVNLPTCQAEAFSIFRKGIEIEKDFFRLLPSCHLLHQPLSSGQHERWTGMRFHQLIAKACATVDQKRL